MNRDQIKASIERAYKFEEEQQMALDSGKITEAQWFDKNNRYITKHYLAADNPRAQSGHSGDEVRWRYGRGMVMEAIHRSGAFLDVGCANGLLIESLDQWLLGSGLKLEFSGIDISSELVDLATKRLPLWKERIFVGNALYWKPPHRYDFVRTGLKYVPLGRQEDFVHHLISHFLDQNGRLIIGTYNEIRTSREIEEKINRWGYKPAGYCEKSKPGNDMVSYKMLWIDKN